MIDQERFNRVASFLEIQYDEAKWWRNACLLYFQQFSNRPLPPSVPRPDKSLEYYKNLEFKYAPGHP